MKIYSGYIMNRKLKRPKVIIKMACSLDGKIALKKNKRTRITNQSVKKIVHIIRSEVDAILVGSNTVIVDNPLLNCRIKGFESFSPYRIVLSQKLSFDINSHIFKNCLKYPTIVFTIDSNKRKIEELSSKKVKIIILEKKEFNLKNIMYKKPSKRKKKILPGKPNLTPLLDAIFIFIFISLYLFYLSSI